MGNVLEVPVKQLIKKVIVNWKNLSPRHGRHSCADSFPVARCLCGAFGCSCHEDMICCLQKESSITLMAVRLICSHTASGKLSIWNHPFQVYVFWQLRRQRRKKIFQQQLFLIIAVLFALPVSFRGHSRCSWTKQCCPSPGFLSGCWSWAFCSHL